MRGLAPATLAEEHDRLDALLGAERAAAFTPGECGLLAAALDMVLNTDAGSAAPRLAPEVRRLAYDLLSRAREGAAR